MSPPHSDLPADTLHRIGRVDHIEALIADINGTLRGKHMPGEELHKIYRSGVPFPASLFATGIAGQTIDAAGLGTVDGDADWPCLPLDDTLLPVPWRKKAGSVQVLLGMRDGDDGFWADPRTVLARIVADLAADGLFPTVALEFEFHLVSANPRDGDAPAPARSPLHGRVEQDVHVYGIEQLDGFAPFFDAVADAARAQRIPAMSAVSEYGAGQYEINLKHSADPLAAADRAIAFRRLIRGVARRLSMEATFMAKPFADRPGNGLHLHVSFGDRDGTPLFGSENPAGSPLMGRAIAGLEHTLVDSQALLSPGANGFRRYRAGSYAPLAACWAVNNRTVPLRIPTSDPANRRIEHRLASADANPYLALAVTLAAMHHGIREGLSPSPPITGNAYETETPTLTDSWAKALDALDRSALLRALLGDRFIDLWLAVKRGEREVYQATIPALDYRWYLDR